MAGDKAPRTGVLTEAITQMAVAIACRKGKSAGMKYGVIPDTTILPGAGTAVGE